MHFKLKLSKMEKKAGRALKLLRNRVLPVSIPSKDNAYKEKLNTLEIGKLANEEMRRFNLGPYSKISTPGSVSV